MRKRMIALIMTTVMLMGVVSGCESENITERQGEEDNGRYAYENYDFAGNDAGGYGAGAVTASYEEACCAEPACEGDSGATAAYEEPYAVYNTEQYDATNENGFASVAVSPISTFSADVDTASYANMRRMINDGYSDDDIPDGAIRTEELVNYFTYDYAGPEGREPFGINATISECPWNENSSLLILGLQTEQLDFSDSPDSNIVFLIDVSGSMYDDDKLPLLKEAFGILVDNLGTKDRVSIVTYASNNEIVLEGARGDEKDQIMDALEGLEAGGSTNGGQGIISAYELAAEYFIEGGNNRIIIATDGDLNVGLTSDSDLHDLVTAEKESGIYLSVLGFGTGNYNDSGMETLADDGNGNYAYIDNLSEAKKVLGAELGATMVTVADDVKFQVEFNPAVVAEYRLVGYENRMLATEDFEDDSKDAGEIGAGHSVTVIYEIVTCEDGENQDGDYRYQDSVLSETALESGEWMNLSVRYKKPGEDDSILLEYPIGNVNYTDTPNDDFVFAATVAEFSMVLQNSEYIGNGSYEDVLSTLDDLQLTDEYKQEFVELVQQLVQNSY